MGILDEGNEEVYRYDLIFKDNMELMSRSGQYNLTFKTNKKPYKYKIWPYSVSKQWLKSYDTIIG
ncbi:MAG: hypothetical protein Barrevirus17_11 [Barrevirus sp.]|uniref:Uncharacterized protein n=1 Tax=Barrevirus sp. TaxID=2487763 RepID=A0A3G4ZQN6_9VIRU|nr:MAG: hypothetical protein Barrevirus17_11 [Barrevirus sp.]